MSASISEAASSLARSRSSLAQAYLRRSIGAIQVDQRRTRQILWMLMHPDSLHAMQFRPSSAPQVRHMRPGHRPPRSDRGVRWIPLVPAAYGMWVARPARTTVLRTWRRLLQLCQRVRPVLGDHRLVAKSPQLGAVGVGSEGTGLPGGPHAACCWAGCPTAAGTKVAPHWLHQDWLHQVACGLVARHRGQRVSIHPPSARCSKASGAVQRQHFKVDLLHDRPKPTVRRHVGVPGEPSRSGTLDI